MVEPNDDITRPEDELATSRALKILTWKYTIYRIYYWTWTLFEFLLPFCLVYLVLRVSKIFIGDGYESRNVTAPNQITLQMLAESTLQYDRIFFSPPHRADVFLYNVMNAVNNITGKFTIFTLELDEESVAERVLTFKGRAVGVVFEEYLPNLKYKIREKFVWNTTSRFSEDEIYHAGPYMGSSPYLSLGFIGLQYFINEAYMKWLMRKERPSLTQNFIFLSFKDDMITATFPYPEYTGKSPYHYLFPIIVAFSVGVTSLMILGPLMYTIINEKNRGMNEIMILTGLPQKFIWMAWYINTLVPAVIMYTLIVYLLLIFDYRGAEFAVIKFVQPSLLWAIVILYFAAQLAFCFTFCTIFHSALFGIFSFFLITMILGFGALKAYDYQNLALVHLSCLCPIGALIQAFERITYNEISELYITWNLAFLNEFTAEDASLGFVLILLVIDIPLYLLLAYYINEINPGKYGIRKSPFFLVQKENSVIADVVDEEESNEKSDEEEQNSFFEPTSPNANVVLRLSNVKKTGKIKEVNLSMNANEIYVIVGSLLTGKTLLVSLITGLSKQTGGEILFNGINFDASKNELRKSLGYCPQEDRLFPYLKVIDHLQLFGRLKGLEKNHALVEGNKYLNLMGIKNIAYDTVPMLSSENKRKLSLTIALMGDSKMLILDEPTTGLNIVSQERIWNTLRVLKKRDCTIIMTTPYIMDAVTVGDRIAIMSSGRVKFEGSTSFLLSKFATGYDVKIKKKEALIPPPGKKDETLQSINQIIKLIPGATLLYYASTEIFLKLPPKTVKFPELFKALEGKRKTLEIERITVSHVTLETIYSRIGGESINNPDGTPLKLSQFVKEELKLSNLKKIT